MKRIQKLIVGANYVLADRPALGGVAASNWVAGKITILKEDYTAYDGAGADAAYEGDILIARYDDNNDIYATELLKKGTVRKVTNQAYQAPVLQQVDFTLTPITSTLGEEVGVRLVNPNNREVIYTGRRTYVVTATGTLQDDIDLVVTAINNDRFNDATAVRNGNILEITAEAFNPLEDISEPSVSATSVGGWSSVLPVVNVSAVSGIGTSDKVALIESQEDWGESQGVGNFREFPVIPDSAVVSGTTYNIFTIEYGTAWGGTNGVAVGAVAPKTVVIAMDSAGTGAALLTSNLLVWLNVNLDDNND